MPSLPSQPRVVGLRNLVVVGSACLIIAAALSFLIGPGQFGLRPAADFKSFVVSAESQRSDMDVKSASDALVRSIIVEWKKKNPQP